MKTEKIKIDKLHHPEKNVRVHSPKQLDELYRSVTMFGQIRPVVVDENNMILAGNGLVEALRKYEESEVNILRVSNLDEKQKKKLMIADNRIYSLGFDDNDTIMEFLGELDGDFDVPGYEEEILENLLADEDEIDDEVANYGKLEEDTIEEFERAGERKEQRIERAEQLRNKPEYEGEDSTESISDSEGENTESVETPHSTPETAENEGDNQEGSEERKSIDCPHCGETIWL